MTDSLARRAQRIFELTAQAMSPDVTSDEEADRLWAQIDQETAELERQRGLLAAGVAASPPADSDHDHEPPVNADTAQEDGNRRTRPWEEADRHAGVEAADASDVGHLPPIPPPLFAAPGTLSPEASEIAGMWQQMRSPNDPLPAQPSGPAAPYSLPGEHTQRAASDDDPARSAERGAVPAGQGSTQTAPAHPAEGFAAAERAETTEGPEVSSDGPAEPDPAVAKPLRARGSSSQAEGDGTSDRSTVDQAVGGIRSVLTRGWGKFRSLPGRHQAFGALIAIAVLVLLVSMVGGGGDQPAQSESVVEEVATETGGPVPTTQGGGEKTVLSPTKVSARCASRSTSVELAFNDEKRDAWVCARAQGIDGTVVTISFRRPVVVSEVFLVPGFNYVEASGIDDWTRHRVVTRVLWKIGDKEMVQQINPVRTGATMPVGDIATQQITLTILQTSESGSGGAEGGVFGGVNKSKDDTFAVSKIEIRGREA